MILYSFHLCSVSYPKHEHFTFSKKNIYFSSVVTSFDFSLSSFTLSCRASAYLLYLISLLAHLRLSRKQLPLALGNAFSKTLLSLLILPSMIRTFKHCPSWYVPYNNPYRLTTNLYYSSTLAHGASGFFKHREFEATQII